MQLSVFAHPWKLLQEAVDKIPYNKPYKRMRKVEGLSPNQQQQRRQIINSPRPIPAQINSSNRPRWHCHKMVKFTSLAIFVAFFLILTTISIYGEQAETKSKVRSKLASAGRKRKTQLKAKLDSSTTTTTTLPPTIEVTEAEVTTALRNNETTISPTVGVLETVNDEIATTSTPKVVKRVSQRAPLASPVSPGECGECDKEECHTPQEATCPTGLVLDQCNCCHVCGALEGNRCYNSTLRLPYNPDVGICGPNLVCLLRSDLDPNEPREALCECKNKRIVCGSDGITYHSECKLREAVHFKKDLVVTNWNPCVSAPQITTPVENATVPSGEDVSLSCEVRAYPAPVLHWEFLAEGANGNPQILPGDDSSIVVVVRGGPEEVMTTSWIQIIAVDSKRQGTYFCNAKNSEGMVQVAAQVKVFTED